MDQRPGLERRLGTADAVVVGLSAMIGAGVFAALGPAAAAAGSALLVGLGLAAVVAYCNAVASAQLAAQYPQSGGTYVHGRQRLGPWWGYAAGYCFVVGKTASCAAMALTFAGYLAPDSPVLGRLVAVAAVAALTLVASRGVTRTLRVARALVAVTLLVLAVTVVVLAVAPAASEAGVVGAGPDFTGPLSAAYGVLQSAALLFFAFAGYARIATLGEEVRDPARTIPRAIPLALGINVLIYLLVAVTALRAAGPSLLAASAAPLEAAVTAAGSGWAGPLVRAGAAVASLGALLALLAGVSRTGLAMARSHDLPTWLDAVHPCYRVPHRTQMAVGVVVIVLVLAGDLRGVIGFSSFGVLLYYGIANAAAFTQDRDHRRWPRAFNVLGVLGCCLLAAAVPLGSLLVGAVVLVIGLLARALLRSEPTA